MIIDKLLHDFHTDYQLARQPASKPTPDAKSHQLKLNKLALPTPGKKIMVAAMIVPNLRQS